MAMIGSIVGLLGSAVSAMGTIAGANAQANALEYQAEIDRRKGVQEQAAAQRSALETQRKSKYALSTLQARASASGAGASDTNVVNLAGDIAGRSQYQSGLQWWQGAFNNWNYQTDASGKEAMAGAYRSMGPVSAFGTILGGAGGLFKSFGSGSFSGTTLPGGGPDGDFWDNRWPTPVTW